MMLLHKKGDVNALTNAMELVMRHPRSQLAASLSLPLRHLPKNPSIVKFKQESLIKPISLDQTKQIHAWLIRTRLDLNCPMGDDPIRSEPSVEAQFNSLITSYTKNNRPLDSLKVYLLLRLTDTFIDNFTIPSIIKACGQLSRIKEGREVHGFVMKTGFDWDVFVQNSLIQMYSECGHLESAQRVFTRMPERDVVSWSTMIGSYSRSGSFSEALDLIREMNLLEIELSEVAVINIINLFADRGAADMGRAVHSYWIKNIDPKTESINVNTSLIDMYGKAGHTAQARRIFDQMSQKTVVTWTAMIASYICSGELKEGAKLLKRMMEEKVLPNEITILSLILECGYAGAHRLGKLLHAYALKMFEISTKLATALVDMYGKFGQVSIARAIFDGMDSRDLMAWTAMISGYVQESRLEEAFDLFVRMKSLNSKPNEITMVNMLMLCAEAGALDLGRWIHSYIEKMGIASELVIATALIDMYAKCGEIDEAYQVFMEAETRDTCMWNVMICGFAMHGQGQEALKLFSEMKRLKLRPSEITFIGALNACSHSGLVEEGHGIFREMVEDFGLVPRVEHYGCMVDLQGRAGMLNEAHETIISMPVRPNTIVWGALLASCKLHKNLPLAKLAAQKLHELQPLNCGYNVLLSNIYAAESKWHVVAEVRQGMKESGMKKPPGFSSIEVKGLVYEFIIGHKSHPQIKEIHEKLTEMHMKLAEAGYVANTSVVLLNVDDEEKETALNFHSEKLAMAFGLIRTAPNTPIRIMKNLRVCDDCHTATKLLSKIYGRVIVVRDRTRFHRFSKGSCSCRDYW